MGLAARLPWWAKLSAKLILARLPLSYDFWRAFGLFRHGEMNVPEHAIGTYRRYHEKACEYSTLAPGFQSLELGPGDSVLSGLVARAFGAQRAWLVDAGAFADTDVAACRRVLDLMRAEGRDVPELAHAESLSQVLDQANVNYLTGGTASLSEIPDNSIDFFFSQVVMEHVPREEMADLLKQLRRIARKEAVGVHSIDFRDHLGGALNNLRFSGAVWESRLFKNSGFYTNRIRPGEMIAMFEDAGFRVELIGETRWPQIPTARNRLSRAFATLPDDELLVAEIEIVVRPA